MLLLLFALAAVAAMVVVFRLGRTRPRGARAATAALCAALVARCVLAARADWEWALFPWPSYAFVQGFVLYALGALFFAAAAATLPQRWNRGVVLAIGLGVLAHGLHRHSWIAWPEVHGDDRTAGADHHVRQSTHYTCGPAACAAALSYCGITIREREIAAACLTRRHGTSLFDLYRGLVVALGDRPFVASIENPTADELVAAPIVAIGGNRGGGHALCIANTGTSFVLHDPLAAAPQNVDGAAVRDHLHGPLILIRARHTPSAAPSGR